LEKFYNNSFPSSRRVFNQAVTGDGVVILEQMNLADEIFLTFLGGCGGRGKVLVELKTFFFEQL